MKELLFLLADLFMIGVGFRYGWLFIRRYHNYLLGLEWMIVATSGTNFLVWSLLGGSEDSPLYPVAYFFDAFSRSIGITLIAVLGLMRVTHRYSASVRVEVGAFAIAIAAGLYLGQFRAHEFHVGPATFYVVANALATVFFAYFSWRLWKIGATSDAVLTGAATTLAGAVVLMYDFFPFPDDEYRTTFYIIALTAWGLQMMTYYRGYRTLYDHNVATGVEPAHDHRKAVRA